MACLYALSNDQDGCLGALKQAYQHGCLPDEAVILADVDMVSVVDKPWFKNFLESTKVVPLPEENVGEGAEINYEPKFNLKKKDQFDYYAKDQD